MQVNCDVLNIGSFLDQNPEIPRTTGCYIADPPMGLSKAAWDAVPFNTADLIDMLMSLTTAHSACGGPTYYAFSFIAYEGPLQSFGTDLKLAQQDPLYLLTVPGVMDMVKRRHGGDACSDEVAAQAVRTLVASMRHTFQYYFIRVSRRVAVAHAFVASYSFPAGTQY